MACFKPYDSSDYWRWPCQQGAKMIIGVDTGLTHLSAILGRQTIELYCDSPRWKTEGYWSPNIHNLGDKGQPPSVEEVLALIP